MATDVIQTIRKQSLCQGGGEKCSGVFFLFFLLGKVKKKNPQSVGSPLDAYTVTPMHLSSRTLDILSENSAQEF